MAFAFPWLFCISSPAPLINHGGMTRGSQIQIGIEIEIEIKIEIEIEIEIGIEIEILI